MILQGCDYDAEPQFNDGAKSAPAVDAFNVTHSDADRLTAIASDMEAEADMTCDLESARILRGAAHKVRARIRGLETR